MNAKVFHLDNITSFHNELKNRIKANKVLSKAVSKSDTGETQIKQEIWDNKMLSRIMNSINIVLARSAKSKLFKQAKESAISEGREYLIVEGIWLGSLMQTEEMFHTIKVDKSYYKRLEHIEIRDNKKLTKRDIVKRDTDYRDMSSKLPYDSRIENEDSLEDFFAQARKVANTIKSKSRENKMSKYRVGETLRERLIQRDRGRPSRDNNDEGLYR